MYNLYCGDCLDIMNNIPEQSVDMILCDLPYRQTSCSWDNIIPFDKLWQQYNRICRGVICLFSSGLFTIKLINSNIDNFKYKLIWEKNVPTGMCSAKYRPMKYYEEICIFNKGCYNPQMKDRVGVGKDCYKYNHYCGNNNHINVDKIKKRYDPEKVQPSDILKFNVVPNRRGKLHPTQKPVNLCEYLIRTYSNENNTILDNCMGSGTTGIACQNTNRNFIGIELDENIFNIAENRLNNNMINKE